MYALRLARYRFLSVSNMTPKSQISVALVSKRNHVYDKRNYVPEIDDYNVGPTARPWDHFTLRANQNKQRRFGQYMLWFCSAYVFWAWFRYIVIRQQLNRVEKWDYQAKYWRDGYWVREFPEGLVVKEFSNGKVSIEPGQSQRPSLAGRILNKIFAVGTSY
eukprot:519875_1